MTLGINVGTVHVALVPDFTGFAPAMAEGTNKTVPPVAEKAGAQFASVFGKAGTQAGAQFVTNLSKAGATVGESGSAMGSEFAKAFSVKADEAVAGFSLMGAEAGKGFSAKFSNEVANAFGPGAGSGITAKTRASLSTAMADAGVVSGAKYAENFESETSKRSLGSRLFSGFTPKAAQAGSAAGQTFGREFGSGANGQMASFLSGKTAALVAVTVATIAAAHAASDFESQTAHLVTDAGEAATQLQMVRQGMLGISSATGTSAEALYQGMYHIESAGYHGAAGLQVLKAAAEGAKVGNADLDTIAKTLVGTMNSYGLSGSQATAMMNQLIATVSTGDMKMQDLALSLGNVAPLAAAAGIKFSDVAGAISTMTAQNMTADRATQDLAFVIRALQAPTHQAAQEMLAIGINANDLSKNIGKVGLSGTIEELTTAVAKHVQGGQVFIDAMRQTKFAVQDAETMIGHMPEGFRKTAEAYLQGQVTFKDWRKDLMALPGPLRAQAQEFAAVVNQTHAFNDLIKSGSPQAQAFTSAISKLTGGATGMNTTLMLSGERMGVFKDNAKFVAAAAQGAGKDVRDWSVIQGTFSQKVDVAKASIARFGISVGMDLLPALGVLATAVAKVANAFTGVFDWIQNHKALVEALGVGIGAIGIAILVTMLPAIYGWVAGNIALVATFVAINAATGGLFLAIAALVVGIFELVTHWRQSWDFIKRIAAEAWTWIKKIFEPVAKFFVGIWDDIKRPFADAITWVEQTFDKIKAAITLGFMGWWKSHGEELKQVWHDAWSAMKLIFDVTIGPIITAVKSAIGLIVGIFESAIGGNGILHNTISAFLGFFKAIFVSDFQFVFGLVTAAWKIISGIFDIWVHVILGIVQSWWTLLKTGFEVFWGYMRMILKIAWDAIVLIFNLFLDIVTGHWSKAWEDIKNFGVQVWHAVRDFFINDFINPIKGAAESILHYFLNDFWHPVSNFFTKTLPGAWSDAVNAIKSAWDRLKQYAADPIKWVIQYVYQDGIRRAWNDIAGVFGMKQLPDASGVISALSNVNAGSSSGSASGPLGVGGHALMATGGIVPGGWGGGDIIPAMLTPGERVLSLDQVSMLGGHSVIDRLVGIAEPRYQNGMAYAAGGWSLNPISDIKHIGSDIASAASGAWSALKHVVRGAAADSVAAVLDPLKTLADHTLGTGQNWSGMLDSGVHKGVDGIVNWVRGDDAKHAAPAAANVPGSVADWINQGMKIAGVSGPAWYNGLTQIAMHESGGNPNVVNTTDINAQQGHPSAGLMQFIKSTFDAYAMPGYTDWMNPIHQVIADAWSHGYIMSRYGGIGNVPGIAALAHGGGYVGYDNGGMWPSGTLGINMTGRDEGVLTPRGVDAIGGPSSIHALNSGASLGNMEVHVYIGNEEVNDHIDVRVASALDGVTSALAGGIKVGG